MDDWLDSSKITGVSKKEHCVNCGKGTAWEHLVDMPVVINNRIRWIDEVRCFICDACDTVYFDDEMSKEYYAKKAALMAG